MEGPVRLLNISHTYSSLWACGCRARFAGSDWPSVVLCFETYEFVGGNESLDCIADQKAIHSMPRIWLQNFKFSPTQCQNALRVKQELA